MGFDLHAKGRNLGEKGYYRASIYHMIFLRSAMLAAGVNENLVCKKFVSNDGLLVTSLQSKQIAERLRDWLKGRKLTLDLAERNKIARLANAGYLQVIQVLGEGEAKSTAKHFSKSKSIPFHVNNRARKDIREFADFCHTSGGFQVC